MSKIAFLIPNGFYRDNIKWKWALSIVQKHPNKANIYRRLADKLVIKEKKMNDNNSLREWFIVRNRIRELNRLLNS